MRIRFLVPLATAALTLALPVASQLKVVTTIPDLADLVSVIGGERIEKVTSLAKGKMNVHAVPLRPSKLIAASQADVFFQIGLSLEHAYVPGLLGQARNPRIKPGSPGFITCAEGWKPIQVPDVISRGLSADLHPDGNPHFNLDPKGGKHLADRILEGLIANDPAGEEGYRARHGAFLVELAEHEKRWAELRKKLRGKRVVMYHGDFNYLLESCGMESIGTLEPKPGLPPTPKHMADLVRRMKDQGVKVILTAKWSNNSAVRFVAKKTGARVVELPVMVGGVKGADSWLEMMDLLHDSLVEACAVKVVTTIPDLADLVSVIGRERIGKVTSLAEGTMDVHAVALHPSSLIAASQADVFFQIGLSLEHAYVPELLGQAHNSLIEPGSPGFITCAEGWTPVEVPDVIGRDLSGDRHPEGNPHFNLDPEGGKHLADRILEGLIANDQAGEEGYRACHGAFLVELAEHEKRWAELRKKLRGKRVVMYHGDFNYLLESCGMESIGTLEPGPGLPPTPDHMADLVRRMKDQGVKVILTAKWSNEAAVRSVARETGARVVELPVMVGGVKGADSWLEMMDVLHDSLVEACVEG